MDKFLKILAVAGTIAGLVLEIIDTVKDWILIKSFEARW